MLRYILPLLPLAAFSQDIQWEKSFGGRQAEYLFDIQATADYGFLLAGSSLSEKSGNKKTDGLGDLDYWLCKMDEQGQLVWQKSYGSLNSDVLKVAKNTRDGGFILGGTSNNSFGISDDAKSSKRYGGNDFWIVKLDAYGNQLWEQSYGGKGQDELTSILVLPNGEYLLAGSSNSSAERTTTPNPNSKAAAQGGMDYWLLRIDSSGQVIWQRTYGGKYNDQLTTATTTSDGGFIIGGYSNSPASGNKTEAAGAFGSDYWVLKLDKDGALEWQKTYGGDKDDQLQVVVNCQDKGIILAGTSASASGKTKKVNNGSGTDFWLIKLDQYGTESWQKTYNFSETDVLKSVVENPDGSLLIGGYSGSNAQIDSDFNGDFLALKTAANGEELWSKTVGSDGADMLTKVIETRDGGYVLVGTSDGTPVQKKKKKNILKKSGITNDSQQLHGAQTLSNELNSELDQARADVNDAYKKQADALTYSAKDAIGLKDDSPIKLGGLSDQILGAGSNSGSNAYKNQLLGDKGKKKFPASGDKSENLGNKDYWIVKLKDKQKKEEARKSLEAFPNPTTDQTNIVVGFPYEKGTLSVFDINGRLLDTVTVSEQTIPVSLGNYPAGIYVVEVVTNKGKASVKIILN